MAKQQFNTRLSEPARRKLDALTERYGSQTIVCEIAIDRLYRQEIEMTEQWAEEYRGSGRLTGRRTDKPVMMNDHGGIAPGWRYVGDMSEQQFGAIFEAEEHFHCHSASRPSDHCDHCREMGWLEQGIPN